MVAPTSSVHDQHVKLLDLLTNRYHSGILRATSDATLELELPLLSHLRPGQRVRVAVAEDQPLIARERMQSALITGINCESNRLRVNLMLAA